MKLEIVKLMELLPGREFNELTGYTREEAHFLPRSYVYDAVMHNINAQQDHELISRLMNTPLKKALKSLMFPKKAWIQSFPMSTFIQISYILLTSGVPPCLIASWLEIDDRDYKDIMSRYNSCYHEFVTATLIRGIYGKRLTQAAFMRTIAAETPDVFRVDTNEVTSAIRAVFKSSTEEAAANAAAMEYEEEFKKEACEKEHYRNECKKEVFA